jgi:FAD/FMN-containing dehydrogenase
VRVDPASNTARVEPGCNLGDVDHETQQFGLVLPAGIVTTTGVAGLTLGGGFGWLSRTWGLTCDHLKSADLITANGEFVQVNSQENEDLFWGIRGGGGNFGIVTSFEFDLRPLGPEVTAGLVFHPLEEAENVFKYFRKFLVDASEEVTGIALWRIAPSVPFIKQEFHGKPVVAMGACYAGPAEEGRQVLAPLKEYGTPIGDILGSKPFVVHQATLDRTQAKGNMYYWKSEYFVALSNEIITALSRQAGNLSSPLSVLTLFQVGGAVCRVAEDETAYSYRDAGLVLNINAQWTDKAASDQHITWARETWHSILPYSMGGGYTNFASYDEDEDRVQSAYGAEKYERLVALKTFYDPDNFFRLNQNIKPQ